MHAPQARKPTPEIESRKYPEIKVGGFSRIDGDVEFYQRVNALARRDLVLLNFGAGRGAFQFEDPVPYKRALKTMKGKVREAIGADIDPVVLDNETVDRAVVIGPDGRLPLADESIDLILADYVLEHIGDPAQTAGELDRVLKPGGWLCARTPNRYGYIALANRLLPNALRQRLLRGLQPHRKEEDIFPAYYRLNTAAAISAYFPNYDRVVHTWDSQPAYYAGSRIIFTAFRMLHLATPAPFRTMMHIYLRKRG